MGKRGRVIYHDGGVLATPCPSEYPRNPRHLEIPNNLVGFVGWFDPLV
jgi:hypothetical protein